MAESFDETFEKIERGEVTPEVLQSIPVGAEVELMGVIHGYGMSDTHKRRLANGPFTFLGVVPSHPTAAVLRGRDGQLTYCGLGHVLRTVRELSKSEAPK